MRIRSTILSVPADTVVIDQVSQANRPREVNPMPAPIPDPEPAEEQAPPAVAADRREVWSGPGWGWTGGSTGPGAVPWSGRQGPQPGSRGADGLDYAALVEALAASGALGSDTDDQDAEFEDWRAAEAEGRMWPADPAQVAALAVEYMPPGAAAAGWLEVAASGLDRLDENGLAGVAIAARQAAARAQATELAAVAQIASRAAAADRRIGTAADGRPARVCRDALGQVGLALRMTHYQAEEWTDLAVTMAWRLPATGQALAAGLIDLSRARLIAQATCVLSEQQAREVEKKILPEASELTRPYLMDRLNRAVINADPAAAERRREQAERQAKVSLYSDPDGTATLAGCKLPAVHAAAAMARITAIARAMKAAERSGGLDLHRARVMIGLLLGTLPYIPPPDDAPPDQPPSDDDSRDGEHSAEDDDGDTADDLGSGDDPATAAASPDGRGHPEDEAQDDSSHHEGGCDDLPAPRDEDAPPDDGLDDLRGPDAHLGWDPAEEDDDLYGVGPVRAWPTLGAIAPPLARRIPGPADGRPVPGLLDAVVPWVTLAGLADRTGTLGRIGPITAAQARLLARAAEHDPEAQWRVIVTNSLGQAIAVTRVRRPRGNARDGPGTGLVGRVTVTITQDAIATARRQAAKPPGPGAPGSPARRAFGPGPPSGIGPPTVHRPLSPIAAAALRAGCRALDKALQQAETDAAAGGCAHTDQSPAYRPPPRLREYVAARDVTCRNPVCRQPAWRADLDHTVPYDQHGKTCRCNLGGGCRRDHQLKQHPRWKLEQNRPGHFTWTTPAGRIYTAGPDVHPA
jgi:hypothetical protein